MLKIALKRLLFHPIVSCILVGVAEALFCFIEICLKNINNIIKQRMEIDIQGCKFVAAIDEKGL